MSRIRARHGSNGIGRLVARDPGGHDARIVDIVVVLVCAGAGWLAVMLFVHAHGAADVVATLLVVAVAVTVWATFFRRSHHR
jgi:hypothetical protein